MSVSLIALSGSSMIQENPEAKKWKTVRAGSTNLDTMSMNSPLGPYAVYAVFWTLQGRPTVTFAHLQSLCKTPDQAGKRWDKDVHADVVETD